MKKKYKMILYVFSFIYSLVFFSFFTKIDFTNINSYVFPVIVLVVLLYLVEFVMHKRCKVDIVPFYRLFLFCYFVSFLILSITYITFSSEVYNIIYISVINVVYLMSVLFLRVIIYLFSKRI